MKQNLQDKGLRKAMQGQLAPPRLSSNFTFRTMLKVEEAIRIREAKQERRMFFGVVIASALLLAGGGGVIAYYWGAEMQDIVSDMFRLDLFSSPYWMFSVVFFILIGFDYWMRRSYFKKHHS